MCVVRKNLDTDLPHTFYAQALFLMHTVSIPLSSMHDYCTACYGVELALQLLLPVQATRQLGVNSATYAQALTDACVAVAEAALGTGQVPGAKEVLAAAQQRVQGSGAASVAIMFMDTARWGNFQVTSKCIRYASAACF